MDIRGDKNVIQFIDKGQVIVFRHTKDGGLAFIVGDKSPAPHPLVWMDLTQYDKEQLIKWLQMSI